MAARFRIRRDALEARAAEAGLTRPIDLAAAIGIHWSNVGRVMKGNQNPGPAFIAGTVMALRQRGQDVDTEDLFELVDVIPRATEAAGEAA